MTKNLLAVLILFLAGVQSHAEGIVSPIGLALVGGKTDIEFPGPKSDVAGVRVALFTSNNENMYGLDIGLLQNQTTNDFVGIGIGGLVGNAAKNAFITGLWAGGFANAAYSLNGFGLEVALANIATGEGHFVGAQVAVIRNMDMGHIYGIQVALVNKAKTVVGLQIGLYNVAENLHGIQIGVWNVNKSGPLSAFPVINVGF